MVSIPPPSQYGGGNKVAGRVSSAGRIADAKQPSNRSFGLVMATFFAIIAFIPLPRTGHDTVRWWAVMVSALFLALALFWTAPLRPLNWLWTRFGDLLNRLVSPIAIGLLFYLAVMPTGLLRRALGNDLLRLRRDPSVPSYWILRVPPGPSPESMKNQF